MVYFQDGEQGCNPVVCGILTKQEHKDDMAKVYKNGNHLTVAAAGADQVAGVRALLSVLFFSFLSFVKGAAADVSIFVRLGRSSPKAVMGVRPFMPRP